MAPSTNTHRPTPFDFDVEHRHDGVAMVWMGHPEEEQNVVPHNFSQLLNKVLDELEPGEKIRAIVLASRKTDFVLGADLEPILQTRSEREAEEKARDLRAVLQRLANFPKPVVAAISGQCLAAGLEIALACRARIASDSPSTALASSEVKLGLIPSGGGTQRLPRLVGLTQGLEMLLSGRSVRAEQALAMRLVDDVVPSSILIDVAAQTALSLATGKKSLRTKMGFRRFLQRDIILDTVLGDTPLGRKVIFDRAWQQVYRRTRGLYPAPRRILEVVRTGIEHGFDSGLDAESKVFGELAIGQHARELIRLSQARLQLGVAAERVQEDEPRPVPFVGVLGAGMMGSGIAHAAVEYANTPARVRDVDDASLRYGLKTIRHSLADSVQRQRISPMEADRCMAQVTTAVDFSGFKRCDLVFEAVPEALDAKQQALRDVESHGKDDVIFASNSAALPIARIAEASRHPETVVGMRYFWPVKRMGLLEIVRTEKTAPWVLATCIAFGRRQQKTVIVVNDTVGFYTTRVLTPILNEAVRMVSEGIPVDEVDNALRQFGFAIGPIKLADEIGIDTAHQVGVLMHETYGERFVLPAGVLSLVQSGRLGRKNQLGFYNYRGRRVDVDQNIYDVLGVSPEPHKLTEDEIAWRCVLLMLNEATRCLSEGVIQSARDGDVGAVLALGFPAFRGGPFRLIDAVGAKDICRRMERMQKTYGPRYAPSSALREIAESGELFYDGGDRPAPRGGKRRRTEGETPQPPMSA